MEVGSPLSKIEAISQESPQTELKKSKKKKKREKEKIDDGTVPAIDKRTEQSSLNVKVEVIYDQADKTPPIVGYFPSGYKPHLSNESSNLAESIHERNLSSSSLLQPGAKFYRNAQRTKIEKSANEKSEKWRSSERMELVVNPNGSNVDFVGQSYKGEAMAAQLCTYALGVLDKKTQTLKIMPVAGNKIFRLEPKVRGLNASDKEPSVLENEELSRENKAYRMNALDAAYGTKKSITMRKKMEALMQGDNPESRMDLDQKIDNVVVNKEALESTSSHSARNIPPHNTCATTPQEAYPLSRIIHTGEWDYLEDIYEIFQAGSGAASNAYPIFVRNRIHKLQEIEDEVERRTYSRIFSYITHLVKFKDLHSLDGASSAKNHRFPRIFHQKFVGMFTPEYRKLADDKINLLISYVLVLTLYVDDFRTDVADIATDLRFSVGTLKNHFEWLGCKIVRENKSSFATLPVPLKFPSDNKRKRRH